MSRNPQANDGVTFNTLDTLEETASVNDESLTISAFATQGQQHGRGRGGQSSWTGCRHGQGDNTQNQTINSGRGANSQVRNLDLSQVQWFWCHQFDHCASNCLVPYDEIVQIQAVPDSTEQSVGPDDELDQVQFGIMATTNLSIKSMVPKSWILLDNASTVDVFSNSSLVYNIQSANWMLCILCAAGTAYTNYIADFLWYGTVWFLHDRFANILSLQQMKQCYRVTYDSGGISPDCFIVHKSDTTKCYFRESKEGLFYLDSQVDLQPLSQQWRIWNRYTVLVMSAMPKPPGNFNVLLVNPIPNNFNI